MSFAPKLRTGSRQMPQMGLVGPRWFHHHGSKMNLVKGDEVHPDTVVIRGSAAEAKITWMGSGYWKIEYRIQHSPEGVINGSVVMETDALKCAFALNLGMPKYGEQSKWLIQEYGADSAMQRCFIRFEDYLNIPGPGTGHDGDANISIVLDKDIGKAVMDLITARDE